MNNTFTNGTDLKGCFWNPRDQLFSCVIDFNSSNSFVSECKESCPKVCSENYWKCNGLCIPVSQPCNGSCMSHLTFKCNDYCVPTNKPCNGNCILTNQINCNGFCLDLQVDKELIIKFGCEGKH